MNDMDKRVSVLENDVTDLKGECKDLWVETRKNSNTVSRIDERTKGIQSDTKEIKRILMAGGMVGAAGDIPSKDPTLKQIWWKWGPWAMIATSILIATISYCKYTGVI